MFLNSLSILFYKNPRPILLKALLLLVLVVNNLQSKAKCLNFLTEKNQRTEKPFGVSFSGNVKLFSEIDVFTDVYLQDDLLGEGAIRLNATNHHPIYVYAIKRSESQSGGNQISISQLMVSAGVEVRLEGELHIRKKIALNHSSTLFVMLGSVLTLEKTAVWDVATGTSLIDYNYPHFTTNEGTLPQIQDNIHVFSLDYGLLVAQVPMNGPLIIKKINTINSQLFYASVLQEPKFPHPNRPYIFGHEPMNKLNNS